MKVRYTGPYYRAQDPRIGPVERDGVYTVGKEVAKVLIATGHFEKVVPTPTPPAKEDNP